MKKKKTILCCVGKSWGRKLTTFIILWLDEFLPWAAAYQQGLVEFLCVCVLPLCGPQDFAPAHITS